MSASILVIGGNEHYRRKLLGLLCNIANTSMSVLENCEMIQHHLSSHSVSAILLELGPSVYEDLIGIKDVHPHIPVALYGENLTYAQTRTGFQHGAADVLDISNITVDDICLTVEHMLDPYTSGANNRQLPQANRFEIIISRGAHFEQQLRNGMPPAFYMNGNRAVLVRANVRCRSNKTIFEHSALLEWINEFGITNTFCFSKQYGQIRLGSIVEQDYVNPSSFRHALQERLKNFFQNMEMHDCVVSAAYISSDFLNEGVFHHLNELVSSVFYMNESQLLKDEIRSRSCAATKLFPALYSAVAIRDAEQCRAHLDGIIESICRDMPEISFVRTMLIELLWNCAVIIGKRGHVGVQSPSISIDSIFRFREVFQDVVIQALQGSGQEAPTSPMKDLIARIDDNPGRPLSIDQIASELNFSRSHFCRLFRRETGMSFTEYLTKKRISKACELFQHTHMSTTEVAGLVGFSNTYYFKQTFRKTMNVDLDQWCEEHCR